jgi:tRNA (adenine57-N1/adenine58-N1)-methyltransferase catalytic subunit
MLSLQQWIGLPFGSKVASRQNAGYVHLLHPNPELWTLVLHHRTQILYLADIATVCCQLELKPGSIVLESGTGSGSLTTSLARAIAPTGHVYTFEFHEQRALDAAKEFEQNGLEKLITVEQRNIEELGFPENLHGKADAVFLDLPGPWKAITSVGKCLKPDGVFCGFSPCIEQVQRTVEALNSEGFRAFNTIEILLREYEITNDDYGGGGGVDVLEKMLRVQANPVVLQGRGRGARGGARVGGDEGREKKAKFNNENEEEKEDANMEVEDGDPVEKVAKDEAETATEVAEAAGPAPVQNDSSKKEKVVRARPIVQGRGHTGYLTFARKAVDFQQQ